MKEQRRATRFDLRMPVELVRSGSRREIRHGETRNISSGGVLMVLDGEVTVGEVVEYYVTMPGGPGRQLPVKIHCLGKVVRAELDPDGESVFAVAATLERYEFMRTHLAAAVSAS